jgi:ribosomal-protein-alanine N-acetyltransferase
MVAEDIDAVMVIEHELFGEESWSAAMFASELAETGTRLYLVEETDGVVTAYAGLCTYAPYESYIQTMAVAPDQQRKGVGSALLKELIAEAQRRGCPHLDLEVRADNEVAQHLYASHGFTQIAVRHRYYQPSGTDALIMRKELSR